MELLLNIVWLVVALAVGALLAFHQRNRSRKPTLFTTVVAIICLVVLLFPAISISDDLHPVKFAIEDSTRKSVSLISLVQSHVSPAVAAFAPISVPLQFPAPIGFQERTETIHKVLDKFSSPPESRGPPSADSHST